MAQQFLGAGVKGRPPYPADRAFVLKFHRDSWSADAAHTGRVEHVASGRSASFSTAEELFQFISGVAETTDADET